MVIGSSRQATTTCGTAQCTNDYSELYSQSTGAWTVGPDLRGGFSPSNGAAVGGAAIAAAYKLSDLTGNAVPPRGERRCCYRGTLPDIAKDQTVYTTLSGAEPATTSPHRLTRENAILSGILALTAVVYLRSLGNGFVLDDPIMFVRNPDLRDWSFLWKAFTRNEFWYSDASSSRFSSSRTIDRCSWFGAGLTTICLASIPRPGTRASWPPI